MSTCLSPTTRREAPSSTIVRGTDVGVVVSDVAVKIAAVWLAGRADCPSCYVEGERPGLMRVHDYTRTADAMDRRARTAADEIRERTDMVDIMIDPSRRLSADNGGILPGATFNDT